MRKLIVFLLALVCAVGLSGCMANTVELEIQGAERVELRSGNTGAAVEITDPETVRRITENITMLKFEKVKPSGEYDGWSYSIRWMDGDGKTIDDITVMAGSRIDYQGYFYDSVGGGIDTALFNRLLENAGDDGN